MMPLTRDAALEQLHAWTDDPSLLKHARTVECTMRAAALVYGRGEDDVDLWGLTGLLHDADYQRWPDEHPQKIVDWLQEQGEPEMAYAVSVHQTLWKLEPKSALDRALVACDELSGFIVACCLVRPDCIVSLTPKSVKKKLKDKSFAAKVDRDIIRMGIEWLRVEQDPHIQFVIDALKPRAEELELTGTGG
jgi:predicted hydrolase (HD superfamily)